MECLRLYFCALFDPNYEWIQSRDLQGASNVNLDDDLLGRGCGHCFGVYLGSVVCGVAFPLPNEMDLKGVHTSFAHILEKLTQYATRERGKELQYAIA